MKHNRIFALLLSLALLIGLCTGCAGDPVETGPSGTRTNDPALTEALTAAPTESAAEATEPIPADVIPVRLQNGGWLRFLPEEPLSIPKLSEMVYTRPDAEPLRAALEALTEKVAEYSDVEALLNDYAPIAQQIQHFSSMSGLAFYLYSSDLSNSDYSAEYDYCNEQGDVLEEKLGALYAAFAASPCRDGLEKAFFNEGFFKDYDDFRSGDETFLALKRQENDLLLQYYALAETADLDDYRQTEKNHQAFGQLLVELIKVRQKIATAKGYDSYMDYSYACDFQRDYSTAQARTYLSSVKALLAPLLQNSKINGVYSYYSGWMESKAMEYLSSATEKMGGPIWESFRFLSGHELYDIVEGADKMATAYTSYLADYEAPIIFVNPDAKDLISALFHEFGHDCDFYCNYGILGDYETGETYSQAMQYLAFAYAEPFSDRERTSNLRATLSDLLVASVLKEGAYADFELQIYALAPEELSVEKLDAIFGQCMEDYGVAGTFEAQFKNIYWSFYHHFFDYPGYVISYSDSAVASLQICRLEAENPGAGVAAFKRLLHRTHAKKFSAVLAEAGLDSPFEEATLEKTAAFLKDAFDMN